MWHLTVVQFLYTHSCLFSMAFSLNGFVCKSPGSHVVSLAFCEPVLEEASLCLVTSRGNNICAVFHSEYACRVSVISDLFYCCLSSAHLWDSAFSLPINTDAEQGDVFMKWLWHLCRWLRAETESQNLQCSVSIFAVVTVCMSQHVDDQQAPMGMELGQPSDSACDTVTSSYTDIEEISVTSASTSFFSMHL